MLFCRRVQRIEIDDFEVEGSIGQQEHEVETMQGLVAQQLDDEVTAAAVPVDEHVAGAGLSRVQVLANGESMEMLGDTTILVGLKRRVEAIRRFVLGKVVEVERRRQQVQRFVGVVTDLQPDSADFARRKIDAINPAGLFVFEDDGRYRDAILFQGLRLVDVRVMPFGIRAERHASRQCQGNDNRPTSCQPVGMPAIRPAWCWRPSRRHLAC